MTGRAGDGLPARGPTAARAIALRVLLRVERGEFSNAALDRALSPGSLTPRDRGFITALVDGTLRWRGRIDYALTSRLTRPLDALPPAIRAILRLGAYQLLFMDAVPARAACDEAVRMARQRGHAGTVRLVNAVLRRLAADGEPPPPDRALDEAGHLAVAYSHPRWLIERWLARYGADETTALCDANNRPAPMCLRPNLLRNDAADLARILREQGVATTPSLIASGALRVVAPAAPGAGDDDTPAAVGAPARVAAYAEGRFSVQGDGSTLVGLVAAPPAGARVLDMCAGVGGKATHLAELMSNRGHLLAVDTQAPKLARLTGDCARLGLTIIETLEADARRLPAAGEYDLCLLDAPCSGTGALRRRPDSRWRKTPEQIVQLAGLQRELLAHALRLVRPGGVVIYATCSLEPEENEDVVGEVLSSAYARVETAQTTGVSLPPSVGASADGALRLLPHVHDTDGMFIARLRRGA